MCRSTRGKRRLENQCGSGGINTKAATAFKYLTWSSKHRWHTKVWVQYLATSPWQARQCPLTPPTPSILTASPHTKKINSSLIISLYLDTLENFFSHNLKADLPIINTSISLDPTWLSNTSVQLSNGILFATQPWQLFLMKQLHRQNIRLGIKKLALSWERVYLHPIYYDPHNRKPDLSFRLDFVFFSFFCTRKWNGDWITFVVPGVCCFSLQSASCYLRTRVADWILVYDWPLTSPPQFSPLTRLVGGWENDSSSLCSCWKSSFSCGLDSHSGKQARINIKIKAYILLFLSITHNLPTAGYYTSALVTFFNQKFTKLVYK